MRFQTLNFLKTAYCSFTTTTAAAAAAAIQTASQGVGGMVSDMHQCYAPIHSMRLCVLRCGHHMRSIR